MCLSATEAGEVQTECTTPCLLSTPICAFNPTYHWFPFLVWCISGSRSPLEFLVDEGAWMMVASTIVPVAMRMPLAFRCTFTASSIRPPQIVLLQQMAEAADGGLVRRRRN